jgi:hypothetical protein
MFCFRSIIREKLIELTCRYSQYVPSSELETVLFSHCCSVIGFFHTVQSQKTVLCCITNVTTTVHFIYETLDLRVFVFEPCSTLCYWYGNIMLGVYQWWFWTSKGFVIERTAICCASNSSLSIYTIFCTNELVVNNSWGLKLISYCKHEPKYQVQGSSF